ncbi:MAG: tetratricopeptide repeat protein [Bacteroidetes bacterium]|nr:tetratricopeptide repeat protein [Bacteroidota bacterium]
MKKIALVFLAVFAALFVVITVTKNKPSDGQPKQDASSVAAIEKGKIIKFWEHYRSATDFRLDGKWDLAAENYHAALELNDRHEDALYYLGNMYLELSRFREAEACWQKLVQVNPKNSRAFLQLGSLYLSSDELFDINKAESAFLEALKRNKEETGPLLSLGEVKLIRGQLEDAASDFEAVTGSNFKSTEAYFLGGYIAWKKGDLAKAGDLFSQAVKYSKPNDNNPTMVKGEGDTKTGKGFGAVTSKSIFRESMSGLPGIQPERTDQALDKTYRSLDALLAALKRKVH